MNPSEGQATKPRQFKANLPTDVLGFLTEQSDKFGSSVNSEIIRAIRERMDRVTKTADEPCKATPTA